MKAFGCIILLKCRSDKNRRKKNAKSGQNVSPAFTGYATGYTNGGLSDSQEIRCLSLRRKISFISQTGYRELDLYLRNWLQEHLH